MTPPVGLKSQLSDCYHILISYVKNSDFVKKIISTYLFKIITIFCYFIITILIARYLGPEKQGLYAIAITVGSLGVQFSNFGLYASNLYFVAQDKKILRHLIANSLIESGIFGGICAIAFLISIWAFPDIFPLSGLVLSLTLLGIPIKLAYLLLQYLLIGIGDLSAYNRIELLYYSLFLSLIILAALLSQLTIGVILAFDLISLSIMVLLIFHILKKEAEPPYLPSLSIFIKSFHYSTKSYLANVFGFLVIRFDLFMVQFFLGAIQAGYYSIAVRVSDMFCLLPTTIGLILFQRLSGVASTSEKWHFTKKTLTIVIPMVIISGIFAILLADVYVPLLFGTAYVKAIPAIQLLIPAVILLSINGILMNFFASIDLPIITVYSPGLALCINISLNYFLIPEFGIIGASIASIIAYGFMLCASLYYIFRTPWGTQ